MSIYGLADCNNFFASCERVFRPALEGRPAVVLSSNDGCIVARSDEAKALGVKMAQPAFQAKNLIEQHSIAVISGNLQFYTDMSTRVMQAFGELVPAVEKYSIDECFLDLTGIPQDLTAFCQDLKHTVRQWTGLPISIGIAETKTLAKIANRLAKTSAKTDGVLDLTGERWRDCPSSKHLGHLGLFLNGGSGSSWLMLSRLVVMGQAAFFDGQVFGLM